MHKVMHFLLHKTFGRPLECLNGTWVIAISLLLSTSHLLLSLLRLRHITATSWRDAFTALCHWPKCEYRITIALTISTCILVNVQVAHEYTPNTGTCSSKHSSTVLPLVSSGIHECLHMTRISTNPPISRCKEPWHHFLWSGRLLKMMKCCVCLGEIQDEFSAHHKAVSVSSQSPVSYFLLSAARWNHRQASDVIKHSSFG